MVNNMTNDNEYTVPTPPGAPPAAPPGAPPGAPPATPPDTPLMQPITRASDVLLGILTIGLALFDYVVVHFAYGSLVSLFDSLALPLLIKALSAFPLFVVICIAGFKVFMPGQPNRNQAGGYQIMLGIAKLLYALSVFISMITSLTWIAVDFAVQGYGPGDFFSNMLIILSINTITSNISMFVELISGVVFLVAAVQARKLRIHIDFYAVTGILMITGILSLIVWIKLSDLHLNLPVPINSFVSLISFMMGLVPLFSRISLGISMALKPKII